MSCLLHSTLRSLSMEQIFFGSYGGKEMTGQVQGKGGKSQVSFNVVLVASVPRLLLCVLWVLFAFPIKQYLPWTLPSLAWCGIQCQEHSCPCYVSAPFHRLHIFTHFSSALHAYIVQITIADHLFISIPLLHAKASSHPAFITSCSDDGGSPGYIALSTPGIPV